MKYIKCFICYNDIKIAYSRKYKRPTSAYKSIHRGKCKNCKMITTYYVSKPLSKLIGNPVNPGKIPDKVVKAILKGE